ncbi:hypothetical protein FQN54_000680 [Arachnomyces sp. PD_36]|nr:hypothetical protein FQN54_000680 [Arachnomyces sp. PD_36]
MFGLGAYESSSEDEGKEKPEPRSKVAEANTPSVRNETVTEEAPTAPPQDSVSKEEPSEPLIGPFKPPRSPSPSAQPSASEASSPYSQARNLTHNLTLPPVPNLDIPPSPPGSPNAAANQKIAHFLSLKKQGVHFNEKLASSSSLKNPGLLQKLMEHAGIDEQAQYAAALPTDLWDVSTLPSWGFKEELHSSQQEVRRKIEEKRAGMPRESIDFVSGSGSGDSSRAGTPSGGKALSSAAERVSSNLNRSRESPGTSEGGKRGGLERRPKKSDLGRKRSRSKSPSSGTRTSRPR